MHSPFPGMDPYLEARWSDVHPTLITAIREALQPMLPGGLRARAEERVLLEAGDEERPPKRFRPDVAIVGAGFGGTARGAVSVAGIVPEPFVVEFFGEPQVVRSVLIVDVTNGNKVVTAIEVLSPWNKSPGRLNEAYRRKLENYEMAGVSIVEIDLLRGPRGRLKVREMDLPPERRTPYLVCVRRGWVSEERWEAYSMPLRQALPAIPIPLRESDAQVLLELQPLIERVYVGGGHDDIDYSVPAAPPLTEEDAQWARELLRQAGRN
jgi:hypothetical protein